MAPPDPVTVETAVRARLEGRRFEHSREVARYAAQMAEIHGADPAWMYAAGFYHDIAKPMDIETMRRVARDAGVSFDEIEAQSTALLHACASAAIFKTERKSPEPYVHAIRAHTVGDVPFSVEDCILYVADFAAPGRSHAECDSVRVVAGQDIRRAALITVRFKIRHLLDRDRPVHPRAIQLYNHLASESAERESKE